MKWVQRSTMPVSALAEGDVLRGALDQISRKQDGSPAAANTFARKRAVLHQVLDYAVEKNYLYTNPLTALTWKTPKIAEVVNPRVVVNQEQARALIDAVREQGRMGPHLVAFFGASTTPDCARQRRPSYANSTSTSRKTAGALCISPNQRPAQAVPGQRTASDDSREDSSTERTNTRGRCPVLPSSPGSCAPTSTCSVHLGTAACFEENAAGTSPTPCTSASGVKPAPPH